MSPSTICDRCLRRACLVAFLAPRIAGLLDRRGRRVPGLLGLSEHMLVEAVCGSDRDAAREFLDRLSLSRERARLQAAEVAGVCRHDPAYPEALSDLGDAPAALFACGRLPVLRRLASEPSVAVVGTRRPSPYGIEVAYGLGRGLGVAGATVVSGLALGIDAVAHRGCLDAGGVPLAVLAGGPDVPYPRRHRSLHRRVCELGLVISEMPPGSTAFRWSFPARNRIMAALAGMTVVVEAAQPSGSLITADFAHDLGRTVGAVPGRVTWRMAGGVNSLLRDGAVPITGTQDVLDELFGVGMRVDTTAPGREGPGDSSLRMVLEAVEAGREVDEMAIATRLAAGEVRAALGQLEADGWIVRSLSGWERVPR
jgi:DNA processing protein